MFALAWHNLWARPLAAALNVLLLTLGLASIAFLLLVSEQISSAFERDLAGIDVVVGAKGSPMQLILSGVFQMDAPTGNIPLQAVQALAAHPQVAELIPVSLGDNFQGFRIVGTTPAFVQRYQAQLANGGLWNAPMQTVLGAAVAEQTGLQVGSTFVGSHGLGAGGHLHGSHPYTVVGVLQPTSAVLDRLVLTATESVWQVHETETLQIDANTPIDEEDRLAMQAEREITLALIRYSTPLAAVSFPRMVNTTTDMQAAAPALEISRLLNLLGIGIDVMRALAAVLLLTAALSVFIALWSAVRERRADIALMRMLGAAPGKIAGLLLCEALWLALLASALALLAGQGLLRLVGSLLGQETASLLGSAPLLSTAAWPAMLLWVPALGLLVAILAALIPAWQSRRVSVFELLQPR